MTVKKLYRNINALIIPTGIGAKIGGYAGDGTPVAKLLAKASDLLITHPNVINAAALTDIPQNVTILEGYLLDRFFANQICLRLNVKHKIAVIMDSGAALREKEITENAIHAAENVYGLDVIENIFYTEIPLNVSLEGLGNIVPLLNACKQAVEAGATALALLVKLPLALDSENSKEYLDGAGADPIGSIEAKISHMVSKQFLIPSAHAPVFDYPIQHEGVVHPRVAAEQLAHTFLPSVFKCLQFSPRIIPLRHSYKLLQSEYVNPADWDLNPKEDDIRVADLSNLVVPYDCCNGVPMIEAHKSEIQLLTVLNNQTVIDDTADFYAIPHKVVNNYLEAAGYLLANTKDKEFINPKLFYV